jgi:peptidoglycan/LPS O-acetylase OafA/YrhL
VSVRSPYYRADIDGLRAVAVLGVVFSHLGWLRGGFGGVDVFFVISGFLITQVIARALEEGTFTFAAFYEKRIRRIVPALVPVFIFAIVSSTILLLPFDLKRAAVSLLGGVSFTSNFVFLAQGGYFNRTPQFQPLLHTWSLAVEEQFYLIYPVLLVALLRYGKRQLLPLLWTAFFLSLAVHLWLCRSWPAVAYFFSGSRAWELLMGALLVFRVLPPVRSRFMCELLAGVGMLCIAISFVAFRPRADFLGIGTFLPCLGAVLLIHVNASAHTSISKLLGLPVFVYVGQISYSLYLWQWPLLGAARSASLSSLSAASLVAVTIASFVIATISWRYVEQPFRTRSGLLSQIQLFRLTAMVAVGLGVIGALGYLSGGWPGRFNPAVVAMAAYEDPHGPADLDLQFGGPCHAGFTGASLLKLSACLTPAVGKKNVLLWGDSHAAHFAYALDQTMRGLGAHLMQATKSSCPSLLDLQKLTAAQCRAYTLMVREYLANAEFDVAILSSEWASWQRPRDRAEMFETLHTTISFLQRKKVAIIVVGESPLYQGGLPFILARYLASGGTQELSPDNFLAKSAFEIDRQMSAEFGHLQGVTYISLMDVLCQKQHCQTVLDDDHNIPLFWDQGHFTPEGAEMIVQKMLSTAVVSAMDSH